MTQHEQLLILLGAVSWSVGFLSVFVRENGRGLSPDDTAMVYERLSAAREDYFQSLIMGTGHGSPE